MNDYPVVPQAINRKIFPSLQRLIDTMQRSRRRQFFIYSVIFGVFCGLAALTLLNSYNWQQRLLERANAHAQQEAERLAEGFAANFSAMIQIHVRDLQFLAELPHRELSANLVARFNRTHTWLEQVSCSSEQPKSHFAMDEYDTFNNVLSSDSSRFWRSEVARPSVDARGFLHIPLSAIAMPVHQVKTTLYRRCRAQLLFGNQHPGAQPDGAHALLLLDSQHRPLAEWSQGHWRVPHAIPAAWTAHLEIPLQHTAWTLRAYWDPQPSNDLQRLLNRTGAWTLLLLLAELMLAAWASIWVYRRFMDAKYQRAHQALHELLLESVVEDDLYARLVQLGVLGAGGIAAYVAVPDEKAGLLRVRAACARNPHLQSILLQLPLSLDAANSPWGQLLPTLAYQRGCRVDPRTPHVSGAMAKAAEYFPELRRFQEVIAWPIVLPGARLPSAVFVLEITRLNHWFFGRSLNVHWESLLHDLERYLERARAGQEKKYLMENDALTGLPNRTRFTAQVAERLIATKADQMYFALAVLDLDMFNEINTSYGPGEADRCLQEIATQLKAQSNLQEGGILARIGGDEFGILIHHADREAIHDFSQLLLIAVQNAARKILDTQLTTSIGWSFFPVDGQDVHALLAQAEEAMAETKRQGGNGYQLYSGPVAQRAMQRLWVHRDFPEAIKKGDIHFFLQPKADMVAGCLTGVELLARWRSHSNQWIGPGKFMPFVEENAHLVRTLGIWAIQEAVRLRQRMQVESLPLQISINIGAKHFLDPAFVFDLEAHCPNGVGITLEITETASMMGRKSARPVMEWCQSRGFQLSMDDFGTGYSSLLSVARMRFDELKLDQSFIRAFRQDIASFGVAGASQLLSGLIQCDLVAEGIATPAALHLWLLLGGRHIQGYLLAPPLPENAFFTWRKWLLPVTLRPAKAVSLQDMSQLWESLQ